MSASVSISFNNKDVGVSCLCGHQELNEHRDLIDMLFNRISIDDVFNVCARMENECEAVSYCEVDTRGATVIHGLDITISILFHGGEFIILLSNIAEKENVVREMLSAIQHYPSAECRIRRNDGVKRKQTA